MSTSITSIIQGIYHASSLPPNHCYVYVKFGLTRMEYGTEKLNNKKETGKIEKSGQSQGSTDDVFPGGLDCKTVGFFFSKSVKKSVKRSL